MKELGNYSGQIYAEPHKSYENVTYARASPISEADFSWACGVTVLVLNSYRIRIFWDDGNRVKP
jgi:hypothetical protein